jgi:hypothetical protein
MYTFKGHARSDGATPEGGWVIDQAGNLYGTPAMEEPLGPAAKCSLSPRMGSLLHRLEGEGVLLPLGKLKPETGNANQK